GEDVEKIAAQYSMTVAEAAAELGIHESAVRQAIAAKRLASWIKNGQHFLDPRALRSLEVGASRPTARETTSTVVSVAPLDILLGQTKGVSLKVRGPAHVETLERISANVLHGRLEHWKRVVVKTTADGSLRAFVLEPGSDENELAHGPFRVSGRFAIV